MRSETIANVAVNAVKLQKFEAIKGKSWSPKTMVHGKRFKATFKADVILRMRRELGGL